MVGDQLTASLSANASASHSSLSDVESGMKALAAHAHVLMDAGVTHDSSVLSALSAPRVGLVSGVGGGDVSGFLWYPSITCI